MDEQPDPNAYEGEEYDAPAPDEGENLASVVVIGRDEDVAAVCGRIDSAPTFAVVLQAPRGNRALSRELGMRRLVRHVEDTGRTVAIATRSSSLAARARQSRVPVASAPERIRWNAGRRVVVGVGSRALVLPAIGSYLQFGVLLIAVLFLAGALLFAGPSATVSVYPVATAAQDRVVLTASLAQGNVDIDNMRFPAVEVSASRTVTLAVATTGSVTVPTGFATATVEITNPTDAAVDVDAGEVLFGPNFYPFLLDAAVTVPANSSATATATADDPGPDGNVPAESITGWATESLQVLTVLNPAAAAGGTNEPAPAVAEADVLNLRQLARTLVDSDEMRALLAAQRPDAAIFLDSIDLAVSEGDPAPAIGERSSIVLMNATLILTAVAIDEETLDEIASVLLAGEDDPGIFVSGSVVALDTGENQSVDEGTYSAEFLIAAEFSDEITAAGVRDIVSGKRPESAESALLGHPGIEAAQLDLSPGWAPWLPRFDFRIDVEFRSLEDEEAPPDDPVADEDASEDDDPDATPAADESEDGDDEPATSSSLPPVALIGDRPGRAAHGRRRQR